MGAGRGDGKTFVIAITRAERGIPYGTRSQPQANDSEQK